MNYPSSVLEYHRLLVRLSHEERYQLTCFGKTPASIRWCGAEIACDNDADRDFVKNSHLNRSLISTIYLGGFGNQVEYLITAHELSILLRRRMLIQPVNRDEYEREYFQMMMEAFPTLANYFLHGVQEDESLANRSKFLKPSRRVDQVIIDKIVSSRNNESISLPLAKVFLDMKITALVARALSINLTRDNTCFVRHSHPIFALTATVPDEASIESAAQKCTIMHLMRRSGGWLANQLLHIEKIKETHWLVGIHVRVGDGQSFFFRPQS